MRSCPSPRRTSRRSCVARCAGCSSDTAAPRSGALSAVTGTLVHALVQAGAAGADGAELEGALHAAWQRLDLGAPWFGRRELARVRAMLAAFDGWVHRSRADGLRLVAVEHAVQLDLPDPHDVVGNRPVLRLRGRVDRLEVDAAGRPVVVDVKTGRTAATARAAAEHAQLAVYQLAAALGAFTELVGAGARPGRRPAGLRRRPVGLGRGQGARAAAVGRRRGGAVEAAGPGVCRGDGGCAVPRTRGSGLRPVSGAGELSRERVRTVGHGWMRW